MWGGWGSGISNYALSIVFIGVGDGPWDGMVSFDNVLRNRNFDNFQVCPYVYRLVGRVVGGRVVCLSLD